MMVPVQRVPQRPVRVQPVGVAPSDPLPGQVPLLLELIESRTASFPVPPGRHILTSAQALSNATRLGFPTKASSCKPTTTCSGNTARTCILGNPSGVLRHSRLVITDARRIPGHRSSITRMEKTLALIRSRHG